MQHNNSVVYHLHWTMKAKDAGASRRVLFFLPRTYMPCFTKHEAFSYLNRLTLELTSIVGECKIVSENKDHSHHHDARTGTISENQFIRRIEGATFDATVRIVRVMHNTNERYMQSKGLLDAEAVFKPKGE